MLCLPDFLGTKDSIKAMISFLENSGAFTKNSQPPLLLFISYIIDRPLTDFIETEPQTQTPRTISFY